MTTANVEYTDTFGGDANYSWVVRDCFECDGMSDLAVMRRAKHLVGLSGVRGQKQDYGNLIEFRPVHSCTIMFITFTL